MRLIKNCGKESDNFFPFLSPPFIEHLSVVPRTCVWSCIRYSAFIFPRLHLNHTFARRGNKHIQEEKIRVVFIFFFQMNQMPCPKPIEFHVSFPPDFNGLWFWLLAPMKGPELSVLG